MLSENHLMSIEKNASINRKIDILILRILYRIL